MNILLSQMSHYDIKIIKYINEIVKKGNVDNISRTNYYEHFFTRNPEIEWAFLASMVSRNAGWNMTDLNGLWFSQILSKKLREQFFFTYERANWLIFSDAFPQLMLYEISKQERSSFFHLLEYFYVSSFMQKEWQLFWHKKDRKRLMTALIINEQNIIQKPVVQHRIYKKKVFHSLPYLFQDWLHYSCVLFPTVQGELYGFSVHDFTNVKERIQLGKRLSWLLFHPDHYLEFRTFSSQTEHTGSRYDYEQYFVKKRGRDTPFLRMVYPIVEHNRHDFSDWFKESMRVEKWFRPITIPKKYHITSWYLKKQKHIHASIMLEEVVISKLKKK